MQDKFCKVYSVFLFSLFLLLSVSISAQEKQKSILINAPKKQISISWYAQLYPKNTDYIELIINAQQFKETTLVITSDIECEVIFSDQRGKAWKEKYSISKSELKYDSEKSFWIKHGFTSLKNVEGVMARYETRSAGVSAFLGSSATLPKQEVLYCRNYKANGLDVPPGTFKNTDGTLSLKPAFQWVDSGNPNNLCTTLKPGIIQNEDGSYGLAKGYQWANSKDNNDFRTKRIP